MTSDNEPVLQKRPENVTGRPCPDGGALNIMGEHFPCQQMDQMTPESTSHEGWAHSNRDAEAIWQGNVVYSSEIENYLREGIHG